MEERTEDRRSRGLAITIALIIAASLIVFVTQFTLFVNPPIGALPEGKTVVIGRLGGMNFIDSPDAWCARHLGYVNLLCRAMVLGTMANNATIYLRLPYMESLYLISTGGVEYES